jgi:methionyl aminopeptidase
MPTKKLKKMREGGKIAVEILREVIENIQVGVTTYELDQLAQALCKKNNVEPAFKGYQGFPSTLCVGPNDRVVHGIPDKNPLKKGDILSIDFGIIYQGFYLDFARTLGVGSIDSDAAKFLQTIRLSLQRAIALARPGNTVGDLGNAIQTTVESEGYSVVREMVGHGVGSNLHENPSIPGFGFPGSGPKLKKGQTLALEAIINQGTSAIETSKEDNWTTWTKDGKLSGLFENTVAVFDEPEILTPLELDSLVVG